ncbi:ABC transporter permease [Rhodobacter sp. SY28-1]|uniref:ABC transporter permease n=1 Tax=Rhodobacter sp. SY28-1 TaxID=2562317 RepID=UPI0010C09721|nr:ABC transporter permease [Rhodobacter sp. SY28-1]
MPSLSSRLTLPVFFLAVLAIFCLIAPNFASAGNFENLMAGYAFIGILAIGQSFPILLRGIDLSVGAILALVGMCIFDLSLMFGVPGWAILPLALLVGTLAGVVNGLMVTVLRLSPFIATLASLAAYRGLVYAISGRQLVPELSTKPITDRWITGFETYFDLTRVLGLKGVVKLPWVPLSFLILLGTLLVFHVLLAHTRFGRDLYAIGGNPEAARLAGIKVGRLTVAAYAISGLCAAIAAILLVARLTTSTEGLGEGIELTAIAAAVIGGFSLTGGTGRLLGSVIGTFLLGIVLIGLTQMGISPFVQQILTGLILLVAVGNDRLQTLRADRQRARALGEVPA